MKRGKFTLTEEQLRSFTPTQRAHSDIKEHSLGQTVGHKMATLRVVIWRLLNVLVVVVVLCCCCFVCLLLFGGGGGGVGGGGNKEDEKFNGKLLCRFFQLLLLLLFRSCRCCP